MSKRPGAQSMNRVHRLIAGAALAASAAMPLAAQRSSEPANFLEAIRNGDNETVRSIVANPSSAAINSRDPGTGEGALHILVRQRDLNWLAFMLVNGARPDLQANDGTTPLALAAQLGWVEGAERLLARGAKADLANSRGETPLILAVQSRRMPGSERLAMVSLLLRIGADPTRSDSYSGYSALDHARRDGRMPEIVRAMEERPPQRDPAAIGPNP